MTLKRAFYASLAVLALAEAIGPRLLYHEPGHFAFEDWPAFGSIYGFISCVAIILVSKFLGKHWLMRPENSMSPDWIHPGLVLIVGAWLMPLLRGTAKRAAMLLVPAVALIDCVLLQPGTYGVVRFIGQDLMFGRVDRLSLVFAYVFALMTLVGMVYALHVNDDAQHVSALTYAGSALGITFAGDFLSLFLFWELAAVSAVLLVWLRRRPQGRGRRVPVSARPRVRRLVPARRDRPLLVAVRVARVRRHVGPRGHCRVCADPRRLPSQRGGAAAWAPGCRTPIRRPPSRARCS